MLPAWASPDACKSDDTRQDPQAPVQGLSERVFSASGNCTEWTPSEAAVEPHSDKAAKQTASNNPQTPPLLRHPITPFTRSVTLFLNSLFRTRGSSETTEGCLFWVSFVSLKEGQLTHLWPERQSVFKLRYAGRGSIELSLLSSERGYLAHPIPKLVTCSPRQVRSNVFSEVCNAFAAQRNAGSELRHVLSEV